MWCNAEAARPRSGNGAQHVVPFPKRRRSSTSRSASGCRATPMRPIQSARVDRASGTPWRAAICLMRQFTLESLNHERRGIDKAHVARLRHTWASANVKLHGRLVSDFIVLCQTLLFCVRLYCSSTAALKEVPQAYSTVTDLARLRGLSTSVPRARAEW